jgi:hypothetical protein
MRADQSLAGTVNGSIIDYLAGIASTRLLITWSEQFVPDGVITGLEILLRTFLPTVWPNDATNSSANFAGYPKCGISPNAIPPSQFRPRNSFCQLPARSRLHV